MDPVLTYHLAEDFPNQQAARKALERRIGDWFMVEQPEGRSSPATLQRHTRGVWSSVERPIILTDIHQTSLLSENERAKALEDIWRKNKMAHLTVSVDAAWAAVTAAQDKGEDVTAAVDRILSDAFPGPERMLAYLAEDRIANRGNAHMDLRSAAPAGDHLLGWTFLTPGVIVGLLKSGDLVELGRNKYLNSPPAGDNIQTEKKSPQPPGWLDLVTQEKPTFEEPAGGVGATAETAGRFDFVTGGGVPFRRFGQGRVGFSVVYGVRRSTFHEQFHLHEDPDLMKAAGGRWVFRLVDLGGRDGAPEGERWLGRRTEDPRPFVFLNDWLVEYQQAKRERNDLLWNLDAIKTLERLGYFDLYALKDALVEWSAGPRSKAPPGGGVARFRPTGKQTRPPDIFGH